MPSGFYPPNPNARVTFENKSSNVYFCPGDPRHFPQERDRLDALRFAVNHTETCGIEVGFHH